MFLKTVILFLGHLGPMMWVINLIFLGITFEPPQLPAVPIKANIVNVLATWASVFCLVFWDIALDPEVHWRLGLILILGFIITAEAPFEPTTSTEQRPRLWSMLILLTGISILLIFIQALKII